MSVSSVSNLSQYLSSLLTSQSGSDNTTSTQEASALSASSDDATASILQELVSLGSSGSSEDTQLYNAKGLLQAVQRNMALNSPLLTDDTSSDSGSLFDVLASNSDSSSFSLSSIVSALNGSESDATEGTDSTDSAATSDSSDVTARIAEEVKKNPTLASTLIQNAMTTNLFKNM